MDSFVKKVAKTIKLSKKITTDSCIQTNVSHEKTTALNKISIGDNIHDFIRSHDVIIIEDLKLNFFIITILVSFFISIVIFLLTDIFEVLFIIIDFCYKKLSYYFLIKIIKFKRKLRNNHPYLNSVYVNNFFDTVTRNEEIDSYI
jgi:ABC-type protease/lipase transport system fused ATPase/permease subunit